MYKQKACIPNISRVHVAVWYITSIMGNKMELYLLSLLLLSTNLHICIGGESVESTGIIYVYQTGTDSKACINGGPSHPCQTLGYALTNIAKLEDTYTSCIIVIDYGHYVFNNTLHSTYPVNINQLMYLEIDGRTNRVIFNGIGLMLSNYGNTIVVLKNIELAHCGDGSDGLCITTGPSPFLKQFSLVNVSVTSNTAPMKIAAQNVSCHHCAFESGGLLLQPIQSEEFSFQITDSSFEGILSDTILGIDLQSTSSSSINISRCTFSSWTLTRNVSVIGIRISLTDKLNRHRIIISDNIVSSSQGDGSFISVTSQSSYYSNNVDAKLDLINNTFTDNIFDIGLITAQYKTNADIDTCENVALSLVCNNSSFIGNNGTLINLYQWSHVTMENMIITKNTANAYLISLQYSTNFYRCQKYINMKDSIMAHNSIPTLATGNQGACFCIQDKSYASDQTFLNISNVAFTNNVGTSLALFNVYLTVLGHVAFDSNSAMTGGGLYMDYDTKINISGNAILNITNNNAFYGGAIYIDKHQQACFLDEKSSNSLVLHNNSAVIGRSIFSTQRWCKYHSKCVNLGDKVVSLPTNIRVKPTSVFPGQPIVLDTFVADCLNNSLSCIADAFLNCTNSLCSEYGIHLRGLPTILINTGHTQTGLTISTLSLLLQPVQFQLQLRCKTPTTSLPATVTVPISLLQCPFGLSLDLKSEQCHCNKMATKDFLCSDSDGIACIKKGYWYGIVSNSTTVAKCQNLFCNFSTSVCSIGVSDTTSYVTLGQSQDDQCLGGHGGPLCTGCVDGKRATYGGLQCIPSHQCKSWHPYFLLLLNILLPFITGILVMFIVRLKIGIGSGYLYGPIFYLAILNRLSDIGFCGSVMLNRLISITTDTFLLNMKLLGFIPWCFFNISPFYSRCFKLLPPIVMFLLTAFVAICTPRLFQKYFRKLPTEGICLVIVISFWSLANTCIEIVTPVHIEGLSNARVFYGPEITYFGNVGHIVLFVLAITILLVLSCIIIMLMVSPFTYKIPYFHRLKPLLDELQSCYKDRCRWYGGVYLIVWVVLEVLLINVDTLGVQMILVAITTVHITLQPYCRRWLNVVDALLLIDLLSIMYLMTQSSTISIVLLYIMILGPLSLMAVSILVLIPVCLTILPKIKKGYIARVNKSIRSYSASAQVQREAVPPTTSSVRCTEREPLLQILQENV